MDKQRAAHPDLTEADYLLLPLILAEPSVVLGKVERRLALLKAGGKVLVAILKVTAAGDENYLVSLYRAEPKSVLRLLRHNTPAGESGRRAAGSGLSGRTGGAYRQPHISLPAP